MGSKVKVAYLLRPAEGGIKTHLLSLLAGIDRERFEPTLICPPGTSLAESVEELGIPVIPLEIVGELNPIKDVQAALRLRIILQELNPDILHIHSAKAGLIGRLATMSRHRPNIILTMHSFVFDERVGAKRRALVASIERFFARNTDRIIAVSQALKDELVSDMGLSSELIDVIYNGITFREITKAPSTGTLIGTVARLAPQKGVENFIRAAALVLASKPDVRFVIAGDGPYRAQLKALADSLSISEGIEFLGFQSDVPALLSTFDVFVLASTRETFGLSVVEAMSQSVPVIASRVGGIPEIIDDQMTGLLVEPNSPEEIAQGILSLLNDREYAQRLAVAGNAAVHSRFSADRMIKDTETLYSSLKPRQRKVRA